MREAGADGMLRGVNRADDETDDEVLAELMREGEDRLASEQREREGRRARDSRWRKFMVALMFLSQVLVELGRRGLQCLQRNVPRYVAFMDRWLVQSIRVSVYPRKKISTLRLLLMLGLAFALPYIVLTIGRMRFPAGRGAKVSADELDEEKIRSHIIVDRVDTLVPGRRQMFLREGGDGLKLDRTDTKCENTVQGVKLLTDSMGYVCTRLQLDKVKPGCCNETDATLPRIKQYTCDRCDTNPPHCCDVFEHCVSCCMHPLNSGIRRDFLTHADPNHPVYSDPAEITVFQYCQYRCRTSSASVQHQNSYRSHRSFCYGIHRPLKVLPTVNSDGLHEEWFVLALVSVCSDTLSNLCTLVSPGAVHLEKSHVTTSCRQRSSSLIRSTVCMNYHLTERRTVCTVKAFRVDNPLQDREDLASTWPHHSRSSTA